VILEGIMPTVMTVVDELVGRVATNIATAAVNAANAAANAAAGVPGPAPVVSLAPAPAPALALAPAATHVDSGVSLLTAKEGNVVAMWNIPEASGEEDEDDETLPTVQEDPYWFGVLMEDTEGKEYAEITWLEGNWETGSYELDQKESVLVSSMICVARQKMVGIKRIKLNDTEKNLVIEAEKADAAPSETGGKSRKSVWKQTAVKQAVQTAASEELRAAKEMGMYLPAELIRRENGTKHLHITKTGSGEHQHLDTHGNKPVKDGMNTHYVGFQHDQIQGELDKHDPQALKTMLDMIKEKDGKVDPKLLECWKSPVEMMMKQPSRFRVVTWSREVRHRVFEADAGRAVMLDGYVDNGMLRAGVENEYLMYSVRQKQRGAKELAETRAAKKGRKVKKEKEAPLKFAQAIAAMGMSFGACDHEAEV
jgi:hypothetical protein